MSYKCHVQSISEAQAVPDESLTDSFLYQQEDATNKLSDTWRCSENRIDKQTQ